MNKFDFNNLSAQERYKLMTASVIPRPIAWVSSLNEKQTLNLAPFSFFSIASTAKPLLSLGVNRENGRIKDTALNIVQQKEAVVHIAGVNDLEPLNMSSKDCERNESEVDLCGLTAVASQSIKTPGIKEAKIRMETKLYQHQEIKNDDGNTVTDFFLLEILTFYVDDSVFDKDKLYIDAVKLDPLSRLAGTLYSSITEPQDIKRPQK